MKNIFNRDAVRRIGQFEYLFFSLILLLLIKPFFQRFVGIEILTALLFSFVYLTAIFTAIESKRLFRITLIIVIPLLIITWFSYLFTNRHLTILVDILAIIFFSYTITLLLAYLFRQKRITRDVIMCSISAYLLIGLLWTKIYILLETFSPGSFNLVNEFERLGSDLLYFSFITLTTLGYGDVTPLSDQARAMAIIETILGQMYVAIMIARLVGIQISQSFQDDLDKKA